MKDPDVRFLSRFFLQRGEVLTHGIEIAARYLQSDREEVHEVFNLHDRREERKFYTIGFVLDALFALVEHDLPRYLPLKDSFARLLAFDALVGAQDRHAENWGVIENVIRPDEPPRFAPIYDTARGLFATHTEQQLIQKVGNQGKERFIKDYAIKSSPLFGCKGIHENRSLNHFDLIKACLREHSELKTGIRDVVFSFCARDINKLLIRRFRRIISELRMELIVELLRFRSGRLKLLIV